MASVLVPFQKYLQLCREHRNQCAIDVVKERSRRGTKIGKLDFVELVFSRHLSNSFREGVHLAPVNYFTVAPFSRDNAAADRGSSHPSSVRLGAVGCSFVDVKLVLRSLND
jgi:hypothetical protein